MRIWYQPVSCFQTGGTDFREVVTLLMCWKVENLVLFGIFWVEKGIDAIGTWTLGFDRQYSFFRRRLFSWRRECRCLSFIPRFPIVLVCRFLFSDEPRCFLRHVEREVFIPWVGTKKKTSSRLQIWDTKLTAHRRGFVTSCFAWQWHLRADVPHARVLNCSAQSFRLLLLYYILIYRDVHDINSLLTRLCTRVARGFSEHSGSGVVNDVFVPSPTLRKRFVKIIAVDRTATPASMPCHVARTRVVVRGGQMNVCMFSFSGCFASTPSHRRSTWLFFFSLETIHSRRPFSIVLRSHFLGVWNELFYWVDFCFIWFFCHFSKRERGNGERKIQKWHIRRLILDNRDIGCFPTYVGRQIQYRSLFARRRLVPCLEKMKKCKFHFEVEWMLCVHKKFHGLIWLRDITWSVSLQVWSLRKRVEISKLVSSFENAFVTIFRIFLYSFRFHFLNSHFIFGYFSPSKNFILRLVFWN